MSEFSHAESHAILCQVIRDFSWGDYGMNDADIGLHDDPEAQAWVADLASAIQAAGFGDC